MSKLVINPEVKGKKSGVIKDVVFLYTKIQKATLAYQSKIDKEYTVDVVVDEETAEAWEEMFPKNGYKKIKTEDFKTQFKIDPPNPDNKRQFIIKLKADAQLNSDIQDLAKGDDIPYGWATRPKVYVPDISGKGVKDITLTTMVGNGSKGDVAFKIMPTNQYGDFPKLTGILVNDLISYTLADKTISPFGEVVRNEDDAATSYENDDFEVEQESPELDDDIPF